jgi:hypothetical protein
MLLLTKHYERYDHCCDEHGDSNANRCAERETVE